MTTPFRSDFWKIDAATCPLKEAVMLRREASRADGFARSILRREMRNCAKNAVAAARKYRSARAA
jgi:hypothetical protein